MTARGSLEDIRDYNAKLVDRYYEGESVIDIARSSGRDRTTIDKLIKADRQANGPRDRKKRPRDPRVLIDKKVLTPRHAWVGLQIASYRAKHDLTPTAFGMLVHMSRVQVRNMELGAHDFTLTQLDCLAKVLETDFVSLTSDKRINVA